MSAALKPLTLAEFLDWDMDSPARWEFDGTQPVAMTGGSLAHARVVKRCVAALDARLEGRCEAFGGDLRVIIGQRVRYPDVVVLCGAASEAAHDAVSPIVVVEVLSPSTALIDQRVKPLEYAQHPAIQAYVILDQDVPRATVLRRSMGWAIESLNGAEAEITLPEIGVTLPLRALYG